METTTTVLRSLERVLGEPVGRADSIFILEALEKLPPGILHVDRMDGKVVTRFEPHAEPPRSAAESNRSQLQRRARAALALGDD